MRPVLALLLGLVVLGCSAPRPAAALPPAAAPAPAMPAPDPLIGSWRIEVAWAHIPVGGAREWVGEVGIVARTPTGWRGTMRLRCTSVRWIVDQDVEVTVDGEVMRIQGSNVREIEVPEGHGGYGWDRFELRRRDRLWLGGEAAGEHAGGGEVRMYRQDAARRARLSGGAAGA